ncbi:MAG: glycoside hydrolase family 3 C-terminal domain-containing protein [Chitinivibrionales bacterium]
MNDRINNFLSVAADTEKIRLMKDWPADTFPRLGFRMSGHCEGLHGAGQGTATQFCQAYGLGETWDTAMLRQAGAIEANEYRYMWERSHSGSLIMRVPNSDLGRDPRWGRTEECYGEDPFLTGSLSIGMIHGVQGNDPTYYQGIDLVKHFLANSNEANRMSSSSNFDQRLFREYYSVPFRMGVMEGGANSYMCAYNAYNDTPCTVHPVIKRVTIKEWGVDGCISTDGSAVSAGMVNGGHKWYTSMEAACAGCTKAGINQYLDGTYSTALPQAITDNLITAADRDTVLRGVVRTQMRLGVFDPPSMVPYASVGTSDPAQSAAHKAAALLVTEKSIVLLKNTGNQLPLDKTTLKSIAIIGSEADSVTKDWYGGTAPYKITPHAGITALVGTGVTINYAADNTNSAAVNAAKASDVAIVFAGNHPTCAAGWGVCSDPSEGKEGIDRTQIALNATQETMIEQVHAANPKTILVLISSFPYAITWEKDSLPAIVHMTHCSQEMGNALANVLFGVYNPAGRLTQTWVRALTDLPTMMDYNIRDGRTYMYFKGTPLYPFGYGLSYTTFTYSNLTTSADALDANGSIAVNVDVQNSGTVDGEEVVQLYVSHVTSAVPRPMQELKGFARVAIPAGTTKTVTLTLQGRNLAYFDSTKTSFVVESNQVKLMVGASSADIRLNKTITVNGGTVTDIVGSPKNDNIVWSASPRLIQAALRNHGASFGISMTLNAQADVDVGVYNLSGSLIGRLKKNNVSQGEHDFDLGTKAAPGLYLIYGTIGQARCASRSIIK